MSSYLELTKPLLSALVLASAAMGFILGSQGTIRPVVLILSLLGTALSTGGANAFNQWMESHRDARMARTKTRPLPSQRILPRRALVFALMLSLAGPLLLVLAVNGLSGAIAVTAIGIYVFCYTPLKPVTTLCTVVGAIAGACPPLIGWAAAAGRLDTGAWLLGAILFAWQIPHFLALGWIHRSDYERAGFRILPVVDRTGRLTARLIILYALALAPLPLIFTLLRPTGFIFTAGSLFLGLAFIFVSCRHYSSRTNLNSRRVFLASVAYLPLLFILMLGDRSF